MKVRAHVLVSGNVQGVFFRSNTRSHASMNQITGWVMNLPDGRVEVVMEGNKGRVETLIEFIRQGPAGASIDGLEISWEKPTSKYNSFEIRA